MDVVESRVVEANIAARESRVEERPQDTIYTKKGKRLAEDARLVIEEGTSGGTLNLPYNCDDKEEEYIYVPPKLLEGRDL